MICLEGLSFAVAESAARMSAVRGCQLHQARQKRVDLFEQCFGFRYAPFQVLERHHEDVIGKRGGLNVFACGFLGHDCIYDLLNLLMCRH